jgi:hypothetical protein
VLAVFGLSAAQTLAGVLASGAQGAPVLMAQPPPGADAAGVAGGQPGAQRPVLP